MNNEPNKLTHALAIVLGELEQVATKLYDLGEDDVGNTVDDASALLDTARKYCKEKRL